MPIKRFLCCLLPLLASAPAAAAALPGFRPLSAHSVEQQTYEQSRELALRLVSTALPMLDRRDAAIAGGVRAALQRTRFQASSDRRSRATCVARNFSLFVNAAHRDVIFVCDEVRSHARQPSTDALDRIAQGFVHEAVHLTGQMDECVATRFELAVMDHSIGVRSLGSQLRYGRQCQGRI